MQWRKHEKWEKWGDREINGELVSFTHLRSFDMPFSKPASGLLPELSATIRVVFDCHVVTKKHTHLEKGPAFWRDAGGHCRVFDRTRYDKSHDLPGIITSLPSGQIRCHVGKQNNYMVWKPVGAARDDPHYQSFFDIYRPVGHTHLLILYVQSAYLKDEPLAVQRARKKAFGKIRAEILGVLPSATKDRRPKRT